MVEAFKRTVYPGFAQDWNDVKLISVQISWDGKRLSFTGEGCGSSGQISLTNYDWVGFNPGWSQEKVEALAFVWERWHLNDLQAGTLDQMHIMRQVSEYLDIDHFGQVCNILEQLNLYEDHGYKYGSQWLTEEVPEELVVWLSKLPQTTPVAWAGGFKQVTPKGNTRLTHGYRV